LKGKEEKKKKKKINSLGIIGRIRQKALELLIEKIKKPWNYWSDPTKRKQIVFLVILNFGAIFHYIPPSVTPIISRHL
jgi:hypothetical protein